VGETVDLQILGCELHKKAFGGRVPPGPGGGAIALPRPLAVIRGRGGVGRGRESRGRKEWKEERG